MDNSNALAIESQHGILLVGDADAFSDGFRRELQNAWYQIYEAHTPDEARDQLTSHDSIQFVIVDIAATLDEPQVLAYVNDYRIALAWSRLPALLLYPDAKPELEDKLREAGATSRFLPKSTEVNLIVRAVSYALNRHLDFRWESEPDVIEADLEDGPDAP